MAFQTKFRKVIQFDEQFQVAQILRQRGLLLFFPYEQLLESCKFLQIITNVGRFLHIRRSSLDSRYNYVFCRILARFASSA